jgi:hypothetical protein
VTSAAPVVTYDTRTQNWRNIAGTRRHRRLLQWLAAEGLDPTHIIRLEIYLLDCPYAQVTERDRNEHGSMLLIELGRDDEGRMQYGDESRLRQPYTVLLSSLPPRGCR